jgi:hypothetical protein
MYFYEKKIIVVHMFKDMTSFCDFLEK